ncbi:uncharacterized protein LOC132726676 isoform X2 [Ruditapes philippinarum]|nr:uncharacterized protein LOC132726676 isoform X2 [Ruditapes philippinarum]XP_060568004.1 uncharacterized protein LOC132726676 isoform X2 [Ruditapes philippinarum]
MRVVKAGILFICILFVHCDRLRKLERKMLSMQTMTYQDISMLRESVDRNFEELERISMIINASLLQTAHLPTPVQTSAPDSKEEEPESDGTELESEVKRLKRGFKDQKMFFHSWKEDLGNEVKGLHKRIEKHSNEIADKVNETSNVVNAVMSFTKDTLEDVISVKEILKIISENVTALKDRELVNTLKLGALSDVNKNFSESIISSLSNIKNEQKKSSSDKEVFKTCSAAVHNSEKIINLLSSSGEFKDVRLVGGSASSGRLEVFLHGKWGTVCDDEFGTSEAEVACRTLGFNGGGVPRQSAYYGEGTGPILFDNVKCNRKEKNLFNCEIDYDTSDCGHSEDVGVECRD